jgi:hypothetical protein
MVDIPTVVALAHAIGPSLHAFVLLAPFGGLRTGEQLALRHRNVDLVQGVVWVRANAVNFTGRGRVVKEPKSEAGTGPIAMPQLVIDALAEHLDTYAQPGPDGSLFTSPRGHPTSHVDQIHRG